MFFNEFLDRFRLVDCQDFLVCFVVFVALTDCHDVGIRRILRFDENRIFLRIQSGRDSVVGVDAGQVRIVEGAGNLSGVEFDELEVLGIFGDICYRSVDGVAVLQFNQAGLLEQEQSAGTVGRVVRDSDFGAVRDVFDVFEFMGVNGHGKDDGLADGGDLQALFLDDVVHVRLMLHGVHIQVAFGQGLVRLDVVVEFDDFDSNALFSRFFSDFFHDFGMRTGSDAHLDFFFVTGSTGIGRRTAAGGKEARRRDENGGEEFFYCCVHVIISFLDNR